MKKISALLLISAMILSIFTVSVVAAPSEKVPVIIGFREKPDHAAVKSAGGEIKYSYHIINAIAAKIPENAIEGLSKNPNVVYIEEDGEVKALVETLPWGVDRIDAELVHSYNKGTGVNVAIIDTGIDYTHPDLDANYKGGYDFANSDADPMDDNGHGTHVAGTVAAEDNEIGVIGVAPEASLYAVKVLDSSGSGYVSDVVAGIEWSVTNDMQVISMSLGTDHDYTSLHDAVDAAYNAGKVLVAAAGNDGNPPGKGDNVDYPAAYSSVIAVAATKQDDTRASWSSTGPAVELSAPGVDIYSTWLGGGYNTISGTSMATPHVSGTVALVLASTVDPVYDSDGDGIWDASEMRKKLQDTADDLGKAGKDDKYGYGLVDADEAAPQPIEVHDVAITDVVAPSWTIQDDVVSINATVTNEGTYDETFAVTLTDTTDSVEIGSETVTLAAGASTTVTFTWDTTNATIGDHILEVAASVVSGETDIVDNSKTTTVTVKEPSHDVAVIAITAPSEVGKGDLVAVDVDVTNEGTYDETFTVILTDTTDAIEIGSETVALAAGDSKTVTFIWDTTNAIIGDHILEAAASVVSGETDTADNSKTITVQVVEKKALYVDVATDKPAYTMGEWAYITVTVTDGINPVEGAYVYAEILTASKRLYSGDGITGADGRVVFKFKIKKPDGTGTYTVTADASKSGYDSGSGSTTFEVIG